MRVVAGPEKKTRVMGEKERLVTAYHEMGHAIVGHFLEHSDPVHKISIISRGQALGYTISLPSEDKFLTTRAELLDTMAMTLGGRAAEEIVFGEITTGASNDLEKVTATAKQMVMRFGMSEKLGPRVFGHDHGQPFLGLHVTNRAHHSEHSAREIDDGIRQLDRRGVPTRERASCSRIPTRSICCRRHSCDERRSNASSSSRCSAEAARPMSSWTLAPRRGLADAPMADVRAAPSRPSDRNVRPGRPRFPSERSRAGSPCSQPRGPRRFAGADARLVRDDRLSATRSWRRVRIVGHRKRLALPKLQIDEIITASAPKRNPTSGRDRFVLPLARI